MGRKIKLIWDFKGEDSLKMAEHHCIHLREFVLIDKTPFVEINLFKVNQLHTIAFIVVEGEFMISFRDKLKPHRGELF